MSNREWVIVKQNLHKDRWSETWLTKLRKNFPEPDEYGLIWLDDYPYVVDPNASTKENVRPPIFKAGVIGVIIGAALCIYPGGVLYGGPLAFASILGIMFGFREVTWEDFYWRKNEPSPIYFNDPIMTPGSIGVTGDTLRKYAKSQHLQRLTQNDTNWWPIIAILLIVAVIVMGIIAYYR